MDSYLDKGLDVHFKSIQPQLHWLPWVGKNYLNSPQGKRLLLLGESHYVPDDEDESGYLKDTWTRDFIRKEGLKQPHWYMGNPINPLIRNTEKAIMNSDIITDDSKIKIWQSVSFYNLVQKLLSSRKGEHRPIDEDFDHGWDVFFKIVDFLKPDTCIVLGKSSCGRLGYHLNNNETGWDRMIPEFYSKEKIINLSKDGYKLKLIFIKHPSSYFSWKNWAGFLELHLADKIAWTRNIA